MGYVSADGQAGGLSRIWETLADIDYTTEASYDFQAEGPALIGGLTHELYNAANATQLQITNGTGLVIQADGTSRVINNATFTTPSVAYRVPDVGLDCGCTFRATWDLSIDGFVDGDYWFAGCGIASPLSGGGVNQIYGLAGQTGGQLNSISMKSTIGSTSDSNANTSADLRAAMCSRIRAVSSVGAVTIAARNGGPSDVWERVGSAVWSTPGATSSVPGGIIEPFCGLLSGNTATTGTVTVTRFMLERLRTS